MATNTSTNTTATSPYDEIQPFQGVILGIIATPGIIGNIFALVVTTKLIRTQKLTINVFVFGLCLCDLAGLLTICIPTWICYMFRGWQGGDYLCDFQGFFTLMSSMGSGLMATSMSLDRLLSIKAPIFHLAKVNMRVAMRVVIAILVFSGVFAIMPVLGFGSFVLNLTGTYCTINWFAKETSDKIFSYLFASIGIIMIFAVVISNINVIVLLLKKRKARQNLRGMRKTKVKEASANERLEMQFARMMILISILFVICWTPFMFRVIGNVSGRWINSAADLNASRLLLLNLVLDPFIYVLTRQHYRKTLKGLVCGPCMKGRRQTPYVSDKRGSSSGTGFTGVKSRSNSTPSASLILDKREAMTSEARSEAKENLAYSKPSTEKQVIDVSEKALANKTAESSVSPRVCSTTVETSL